MAAALLAIAFIVGSVIAGNAAYKVKSASNNISVIGSAQKTIKSDVVKWRASFTRSVDASNINSGYSQMKKDLEDIMKYLKNNGVSEDKITVFPVNVSPFYRNEPGGYSYGGIPAGYTFNQSIIIESNEIEKITKVAQDSGILISQGVVFTSQPPEYYYSKLADLKREMLTEATGDAKARAQSIANSTNVKLGQLRSASMGVFQITAPNSTEVSDYGMYDVSTIDKQITSIVRASFSIK